jgi:putative peptidoglycan lipid II flippase
MFLTAGGTLGSRVLGLVRDELIVGLLGSGAVASGVLFALLVPNLFRRLLGEGALTAAVMPVMSEELAEGGRGRAFRFLNVVRSRMGLLMAGLTVVGMGVMWAVSAWEFGAVADRHRIAAGLTVVCLPYMPLVCLAALFTAALNLLGRFGVTSLSAVWLNVAMIGAVGGAWVGGARDEVALAVAVCAGALVGGGLQLAVPAVALAREGWRPGFSLEGSGAWVRLRGLFLPAVAGAGVQQVNFLVSRCLALNLDDQSLTVYYLANRVVELPIGVFAIAVSSVIFPAMAVHAAAGRRGELGSEFAHGMRLIFAINIPAAVGLMVLGEPVVRVLFEHGKFDAEATRATVPVLRVFAAGAPFYGVLALVGRGLNALGDVRSQARVAVWVFGVNLVLSPVLAWCWGAPGLAVANWVSVVFQCAVLWRVLARREGVGGGGALGGALARCVVASGLMGVFAHGAWGVVEGRVGGVVEAVALAGVVVASAGVYFLILGRGFRYPEVDEVAGWLLRRRRRGL